MTLNKIDKNMINGLPQDLENINTQLAQTSKQFNTLVVDKTEIIAHRGFSHIAPENTLVSFNAAIIHGADSLECDIHLTSDNIPVLIHDYTVDRTTNGTGNVKDKTLSDLQQLDAGSKFSAVFAGVKIPTFDDFLLLAKNNSKFIYPEIKGYDTFDRIPYIVNKIVDHDLEDRCVIQSFAHGIFPFVRSISQKITLGYLVQTESEFTNTLPSAVADGNAVMLCSYQVILDNPTLVNLARGQGVDVAVWTVDKTSDVQRLAKLGVKRIMTNRLRGEAASL